MPKPWAGYRQIVIETYSDGPRGDRGSIRARPVSGESYPASMNVECSKAMREAHPLGTRLKVFAKETSRQGGPPFLYTHFSWPYEVVK